MKTFQTFETIRQLGMIRSGSLQSAIRMVTSSRVATMKSGGSPYTSQVNPSRSR
jgi:hypothetical protein